MPEFLASTFGNLSPDDARLSGPGGAFSPVEHCWHLADLEREGFAERIRRLRAEVNPVLPDFDGARIAEERAYKTRSLSEGIESFREARLRNLQTLRSITSEEWLRSGNQDGMGVVMLCDLPTMMEAHDAAHRSEIDAWVCARAGGWTNDGGRA